MLTADLLPTDLALAAAGPAADDDRYHALRAEIEALSALAGPGVDWTRVEALAAALLRERAPDLLVLAYFVAAHHRRRGLAGLHAALGLLHAALDQRWDDLTPPPARPRIRAAAIAWLIDQILAASPRTPLPHGRTILADLLPRLRALADLTSARLHHHAPAFGPLLRALDDLHTRADPPDPTADPADPDPAPPREGTASHQLTDPSTADRDPAPPSPASRDTPPLGTTHRLAADPTAASTGVPPTDPLDGRRPHAADPAAASTPSAALPALPLDAPPDRQRRALGDALIDLAHHLRGRDPSAPAAYRLIRVGLWLHLDQLPPLRDGRSAAPPLQPRDQARLDDLAAAQRWTELIDLAERLLPAHRLALDLHRRVAEALHALHALPAAAAVRDELRALHARLPGLLDLLDRDGAPLADPATRAWLTPDLSPPSAPISSSPAPLRTVTTHDPSTPPSPRAPGASTSSPPTDATARPPQHALPPGPRVLLDRLSRAEAHLRAGQPAVAAILLRGLLPALDHHDLDCWDPPLAARVLAALAAALPDSDPQRPPLLIRLGALDPDALACALA